MGRRRLHIDPAKPLPPGLYRDWQQYRARLPGKPWVSFGTDYIAAMAAFAAWKQQTGTLKTIAWLLDLFVGQVCQARVKAKTMAARTARD